MSSGHFLSIFFPGGGKHFSSYYFFAISLQYLAFSYTVFLRFCIPYIMWPLLTCRPNLHLLLCHSQTMSVLLVVLKAVRYNWGWANHQVYTRGLCLLQTGNLWFEVHLLGQLRIEYKLVGFFGARCCIFYGISIHGCAISVPKYLVCAFSFQIYFLWKGITLGLQKTL